MVRVPSSRGAPIVTTPAARGDEKDRPSPPPPAWNLQLDGCRIRSGWPASCTTDGYEAPERGNDGRTGLFAEGLRAHPARLLHGAAGRGLAAGRPETLPGCPPARRPAGPRRPRRAA